MILRNGICVGCLVVAALGCGSKQGDDDDKNASPMGGSGGTSGDTSAGGTSAGGSSTGGSATGGSATGGSATGGSATGGTGASAGKGSGTGGTTAGTSSGGAAGTSQSDTCTNTFGTPTLLIPDTPGVLRQSLTVTGDDLELYYEERRDGDSVGHVLVRKRSDRNAPFGDPTELDSSIWNWCQPIVDPSLDVSDDGLHLYLTCVDTSMRNDAGGFTSSPIRMADRPTREAVFALNPKSFGTANVSFAVSQDELTAVWSEYSTSTTPLPVMAARSSKTDSFGASAAIPGITDSIRNPELANDGVHLFASLQATNMTYHIYMYSRGSNGVFLPLVDQDIVVQHSEAIQDDPNTSALEGISDYTPSVSGDCKSLYFMRRTVASGSPAMSEIYVAKR